jgi:hypothetical protein
MMSDAKTTPPPPLAEFLRRLARAEPDTWADCLRDDQRFRWLAGEPIRVEDYLDGLSGLAEHFDALLDLVYGEVLLRESQGEMPQLEEFQARFPAHREALARQWEVHLVLEDGSLRHTRVVPSSGPDTPLCPSQIGKVHSGSAGSVHDTRPGMGSGREPVLSGYDVLQELGRGGNGVVYLARQRSLNRLVAIKMITPERSLTGAQVARIRAEAELIARLQHPNIVSIYRVGLHEGKPYLVLEYVPGGSLAQRLAGRPWSAADAMALVETLARTLAVVHEQGIVHRDLKPGNVLLSGACGLAGHSSGGIAKPQAEAESLDSAFPKIVDFGLAKTLDEVEPPAERAVT